MTEGELDALLASTREQIAADIDDERASAVPDFASMIAAAHEHDRERVPIAWVHEADELAPVLDLRAREGEDAMIADEALDALVGEARMEVERDVADRRLAAIPSFSPPPGRARERSSRPRSWIPLLLVAAAIAGLAFALPRLFDRFVDVSRSEAHDNNQAEFQSRPRDSDEATEQPPRMQQVDRSGETGEAITMPEPGETPRHHAPPPSKTDVDPPKADTSKRSLADRIAALDEEAQRRWAAGELEAAEEAFRAIVELAGRGRHADLAYGDLFTLTHQRKDEAAELSLWREYLRRFPSGRFADDARAGVCRRGPAHERESCWQAYLDDFPSGVHRRSAERALDASDPP
jgi:hypothetical protein